MYAALYEFGYFEGQGDPVTEALAMRTIVLGCDFLFNLNCDYLEAYPETPLLYQSGVYYRSPDLECGDVWSSIDMARARKYGDCKTLACWLAAEYWVRRRMVATPYVKRKWLNQGAFGLYHVVVQFENGTFEDPSRRLGMPASMAA